MVVTFLALLLSSYFLSIFLEQIRKITKVCGFYSKDNLGIAALVVGP